jgi:predicted phosphoadenosine phosphosulfate sulfurtransferase
LCTALLGYLNDYTCLHHADLPALTKLTDRAFVKFFAHFDPDEEMVMEHGEVFLQLQRTLENLAGKREGEAQEGYSAVQRDRELTRELDSERMQRLYDMDELEEKEQAKQALYDRANDVGMKLMMSGGHGEL